MGIGDRLSRLERAFGPEEPLRVMIVYTPNWPDGPDPEIPEWAHELVEEHLRSRPWLGGVEVVKWSKQTDADEFDVEANGEHFHVTRTGLVPVPEPFHVTYRMDTPREPE